MDLINEDVVISGVGGIFPKANNIEELKTRLYNNENLLESRWKAGERGVSNQIGKVHGIDLFDHAYFGIHREQSFYMDPMQRLVLERTFEALIDAGVNPNEIKGRRIGVYMGSAIGENDNLFMESVVSGFGITGHSRAMMPNRISYWLNLKGPSVAYDINWVSGLEVLRMAFDAIRTGQCEAAIIGTSNLALNSEMQWIYDDMGLLSREGKTKSFDADADGYTRSDGVVVLFVQKASLARRTYASIVHVDTCFNAPPKGNILKACPEAMTEFLTKFYDECKVKPEEIEFVEAYGCGLKETDKIEVDTLEKIYCPKRHDPLLIGSIKSNTGHSEASSCLFSIVKVLLAMETGIIPANLNFNNPNPEISALVNGKIRVVTENTKWKGQYAAVNGIGIDSYYGHLVLKSNSKVSVSKVDELPRLVLASTRTEEGIKSIIEALKAKPKNNPEYIRLLHDLFAQPILGHLYRGYAVLGTEEEKFATEYHMGNKRQVWFVYSGMGSQWVGMASNLMNLPVFAKAINKCHETLKSKNVNLLQIITGDDPKTFDNILHSFVGIAAIQIGLTDILRSVGIQPDGIIGHSVGELGCAYADGCITAEQMILAAYSRGKASLEVDLIKGMMAAVGLGYQQMKNKVPPTIEVACHNGPDSSTISGPTEDMEKFVKELQDEGVFARLVNVANIAYHSRYIKPAAPLLLKYLKEVIPEAVPRSSKWISTSNLEEDWNSEIAKTSSPEYHTNNLLSSVFFEEGLKHIPKDSILIEIAPHGLLQAILKRSLKSGCTNIPLTARGNKDGIEMILNSLGKMYLAGMDLNVAALYPEIEYPVGKGTPTLTDLVHWNHSETWRTGLEGKQIHNMFGFKDIQVTLNSEEFRETVGHQFDEKIILPLSTLLTIVYDIYANIHVGKKQIVFEDIYVRNVLQIPKMGSVPLYVIVQKGSGRFEFVSNNDLIMSGKISLPADNDNFIVQTAPVTMGEDNIQLSGSDVYNELHHRGHKYTGAFKSIKKLLISEQGSVSAIQWNLKWQFLLEAMIQQLILSSGERRQEGQAPKTIQKIAISQALLPEEKADVEVNFEFASNIISGNGIQIVGMKATSLQKDQKSSLLDAYDVVSLESSSFTKVESVINAALQITLENFVDPYVTNIMVAEVQGCNASLTQHIKNVLNECTKLNSNLVAVSEPKQVIIQESNPLLIVCNDTINPELVKLVTTSHGFLLVKHNKNILNYSDIIQIAKFEVENFTYSLVRKVCLNKPAVITVKGDTLTARDLNRGSISWVNELTTAINNKLAQSIYLVTSLVPTEGFTNFVQELRTVPNMENLRFLFILDRKLEFNPTDSIIETVFKQDLILTIIKEGSVSSYIPIPLQLKEDTSNSFAGTSNLIKNKTITYLGVNLRDETIGVKNWKKNELGNIDYAGINNSNGQRVVGLATMDRDSWNIVADSILQWNVPDNWSLEDAATIPHAYTCAYYALFTKGELQPGETVFIHAGCSQIGMAAIYIAKAHGCKVFTTVSTPQQKAFIKHHFPFFNENTILSSENSNFLPLLKAATGGHGAEVILNCLSGSLLQASVDCLASYGRFIQIGKYDLEENSSIGMNVFLRNTAFYVVTFERIFDLHDEVKRELHKYVQDGIQSLAVRPIIQNIVEHHNIDQILSTLKQKGNIGKILLKVNNNLPINKLNVNKPTQFICDGKGSYLIYGGTAEYWTDMTEWLILRGAKKIIIASDSKPQQNHINRRLSLLQSYFAADIILAQHKAHTREGAAELLSEVYFVGPIQGVFLLPSKGVTVRTSEVKPIQYIDHALRTVAPKALLVNFVSSAAGLCYHRSEAGFLTYNVQWLKELEFADTLHGLDDILSRRVRNILVRTDRASDFKKESTQALFKKLNLMLPSSVETVCRQTRYSPQEPLLDQMVTYGPKEIRELIPMFVVPGLSGEAELEEFCKHLMVPTYCTVLPAQHMPLTELAAHYVKQIKNIWPDGPYNITGISWGGALAIEIARKLNEEGPVTTHMHFLDAAPNTLQAALKHLGEDDNSMDVNLINRIFNISDMEVIKQLKQSSSWDDRVNLAIEYYKEKIPNRDNLKVGLLTLRNRLRDLLAYQPNEELLTGKIYFIRPTDSSKYDNCGLTSYCKTTPLIHLVQGDHLSILTKLEAVDYINENFNLI